MKYFDGMKKYGIEIEENNDAYFFSYVTGDHIDSIKTIEIRQDEAKKIKELYQVLDGLDVWHSDEGKRKAKEAATEVRNIINYYRNKESGLI